MSIFNVSFLLAEKNIRVIKSFFFRSSACSDSFDIGFGIERDG